MFDICNISDCDGQESTFRQAATFNPQTTLMILSLLCNLNVLRSYPKLAAQDFLTKVVVAGHNKHVVFCRFLKCIYLAFEVRISNACAQWLMNGFWRYFF